MPRPAIHHVAHPKHWSVLVAPVRLEVVEAMRMIAPCSIAEIAAALDRPADTLYRHIDKLKRAGMVVEAGVRRSGRRFEQVYDLVADDFRVGFKEVSGRTANKAYNDTMQSILKIASRTARDSAAASELVGLGDDRNIIGKIEHAWLTQEEFLELREMMMKVKLYMDARKARREGRLYLAAVIAMPVTRKRGAKRNGAGAKSAPKSSPAPSSATTKKTRKKAAKK
jgi:DNA-binding transcriptional ArsR family regulator